MDASLHNYLANVTDDALDAEIERRDLHDFIRQNWRYIDPSPYKDNWHIEAICKHLQAVSQARIRRLLITLPPRCMKSIGVSVAWPAWDWIDTPQRRFLFASYAQSLSTRDAVKSRRLIYSRKYRRRYLGTKFNMTSDQNAKQRYDNDQGGYRLATSVGGALTGEGGDIIVIDDPHNVLEGESDAVRKGTLEWWDESMSTRLNDPDTGAFVVIQQRVHEDDLAGHVISKEKSKAEEAEGFEGVPWVHLNLPMRFEEKNRCVTYIDGEEFWRDPRQREGELLWPKRYSEPAVKTLENDLGPYGTAGQLQQRPTPREGGMFHPDNMEIVHQLPSQITRIVRYWDKAGTEGGGAHTAGVKMGVLADGRYIVINSTRGQWRSDKREKYIKMLAEEDGKLDCEIGIEQEPGSGGLESAQNTVKNLAGWRVRTNRPTGDKIMRADPFSVQVNGGNVLILKGGWNKDYIEELRTFPKGKFKDQVDASSGAFTMLTTGRRAGGF